MSRQSNTPATTAGHHPAALLIVALIALIVTACGSADESAADGSTTTSTVEPSTETSAVETDATDPDETGDDESADGDAGPSEEEVAAEELAAEDVPAYVAAYQEALLTSSLQIADGEPRPIDRAEFIDGITIRSGADSVEFVLGVIGIEAVSAELDGEVWGTEDEATLDELALTFDAIEPGDVWEPTITLASLTDPSMNETVSIRLDTDLIGGGDSSIQVVDGYATITGVLGTETYLQLQEAIDTNPEVDTLVMLNVEGSENDAINLHTSRLIRRAGWTTWLPANGDISSGGVDMFLAGEDRVIEPGGFLGVHSWGSSDGDVVAAELPEDHPAHRAQLDYVTEMLGPDLGPDFYFYTLEAAPATSIHRMTPEEVETYGLATRPADAPIPAAVTGPAAGYLQLVEQVYLKHRVLDCEIDGDTVTAELESEELGPVRLDVTGGVGQLTWSELPAEMTEAHPVTGVSIDGEQISVAADLDLDELIGQDTSGADFSIDCSS